MAYKNGMKKMGMKSSGKMGMRKGMKKGMGKTGNNMNRSMSPMKPLSNSINYLDTKM